jgi:hypothetical protein
MQSEYQDRRGRKVEKRLDEREEGRAKVRLKPEAGTE